MNIGHKDPPPFAPDAVVVAGVTFFHDDGSGRMSAFPVQAGERRRGDDALVLRTADMWFEDGRQAAWIDARNRSAAERSEREAEEKARAAR